MRAMVFFLVQTFTTIRSCSAATGNATFCALVFFTSTSAVASVDDAIGKVGSGQRKVQLNTCQVPVIGKELIEGNLAEIVDSSGRRVALVKIERIKSSPGRLFGTVLVGSEKCRQLRGLAMRAIVTGAPVQAATIAGKRRYDVARITPQFILAQTALPGLALNKFLTPGYTQRGFAVGSSLLLPRHPFTIGSAPVSFKMDTVWAGLTTSPAIDIVKDGKIEGIQTIATQSINARAGTRIHYLDSQLWSGIGAVLYDGFQSKSKVTSLNGSDAEKILRVIRDLKGNGFGVFAEQGIVINNTVEVSLSGGVGLKTAISTPIVEDGDATNSSEKATIQGLPIFAGASLRIPFLRILFAEVNLEYRKYTFRVPLINQGETKAQYDSFTFASGLGISF